MYDKSTINFNIRINEKTQNAIKYCNFKQNNAAV